MCSPRWLQTQTPSTVIKRFHLVLAIVDVEVASKRLAECLSLALEAAVRRVLGERRLWAEHSSKFLFRSATAWSIFGAGTRLGATCGQPRLC